MAYKVIILYQLYMPSYFLGTFTEYPYLLNPCFIRRIFLNLSGSGQFTGTIYQQQCLQPGKSNRQ